MIKNTKNKSPLHVAAIDIGSNAMRALVVTCGEMGPKTIRDIREPLRLGEDVFKHKKICPQKMIQAEEAFINLLNLFSQLNVTLVDAVATSAMREAKNADELIKKIHDYTGIKIRVIDGMEEAHLIYQAVKHKMDISEKNALMMDIGGGSTEITISKKGRVVWSKSFDLGTVRLLSLSEKQLFRTLQEFADEVHFMKNKTLKSEDLDLCIGTGGNLRRMGKLRSTILYANSNEVASLSDLKVIYQTLIDTPFNERVSKLDMRPDRADVIIPATAMADILLTTLKRPKIYLPKVGLKDGVLLNLLLKNKLQ